MTLFYANQYITTTLSKIGGLNSTDTAGIVLGSVAGIDITKPSIALLTYSDPLDTSKCEWISYTSINGSNELVGVIRNAEGFGSHSHGNGCAIAFPLSKSHINNLIAFFSEFTGMLNLTYQRDIKISAKTVSGAADRYTLLSPNRMLVSINSVQYFLPTQVSLDLSVTATWDDVVTDYRIAANRIGKNFYVYACVPISGTIPDIKISINASTPTGYAANTSFKIGGFHCLGVAVGTISGHTLTGYVAGDILPQSVWDLKFKPQSAPEGMVYDNGSGKWVDIYLVSVSGGELASIYGGTIADGGSAVVFHWYKFAQWMTRIKKKLPDQIEFMSLSMGANQGTNITASTDPVTTGGHIDTAARRMISNIGCEDCCGVLWQWGRDRGGGQTAASWINAYDVNDTGQLGQHYLAPFAVIFGGAWSNGVYCGSRSTFWNFSPLGVAPDFGARGVSEPVVGF